MDSTNHHDHQWNNNHEGNLRIGFGDDDDSSVNFIILRIICTLFLIAFIIPNMIIIVTYMKEYHYRNNFFYTIVHRSFANLLHMVFAIYMLYVSEDLKNEKLTLSFFSAHCIISGISLIMAICSVFDKLIISANFCVRTIRTTWILTILAIAIVLYLVSINILDEFSVATGYIAFSSLIVLIFILRLLYFCCNGSEDENYQLRAGISAIFIFSSYAFTSWVIVEVLLGISPRWLFLTALGIILANGLFNLSLLYKQQQVFHREREVAAPSTAQSYRNESTIVVVRYLETDDLPSHTRVTETAPRCRRRFSRNDSTTDVETSDPPFHTRITEITQRYRMGFGTNESPTVSERRTEASDLPPKYDDECEAPPNYEEAAKIASIYKSIYQNRETPIQETPPVYELPFYEEIDQYRRYTQRNGENEDKNESTV